MAQHEIKAQTPRRADHLGHAPSWVVIPEGVDIETGATVDLVEVNGHGSRVCDFVDVTTAAGS